MFHGRECAARRIKMVKEPDKNTKTRSSSQGLGKKSHSHRRVRDKVLIDFTLVRSVSVKEQNGKLVVMISLLSFAAPSLLFCHHMLSHYHTYTSQKTQNHTFPKYNLLLALGGLVVSRSHGRISHIALFVSAME